MSGFRKWQEEYKQCLSNITELTGKTLDEISEAQSIEWLQDAEWEETSPIDAVTEDLTYWD